MEELLRDEEEEEKPSPVKYILLIFLILLIVLMVVPYYGIKSDPSPKNIPTLDKLKEEFEIKPSNQSYQADSIYDFKKFVKPSDPLVRNIATKISTTSCKNSKVCNAKALYYFVRDNLYYVSDPNTFDYVEEFSDVLVTKGVDCDGYSITLSSLMESIGIDARLVFIPGHVYVQIYLPEALKSYKSEGEWVSLDATCSNCEFGKVPYKNLNKNKQYLDVP